MPTKAGQNENFKLIHFHFILNSYIQGWENLDDTPQSESYISLYVEKGKSNLFSMFSNR